MWLLVNQVRKLVVKNSYTCMVHKIFIVFQSNSYHRMARVQYDFCILFNEESDADYQVASQIFEQLEQQPASDGSRNLTGYFSPNNDVAGKTRVQNYTDAIEKSQVVFVLISQDALENNWWKMNAHMLLTHRIENPELVNSIIPVPLSEQVQTPAYLAHLTKLYYEDSERFWSRLRRCLQ